MTHRNLYERPVEVSEMSLMRAKNKSMTNLCDNSKSFIMFMTSL